MQQLDLAAQASAKLATLASAKLAPAANGRGMKYPAGVASASASGSGSAGSAAAVASATSASSAPRRTVGQASLKSKAPLKRKAPAGTKALKEIRKYQKSTTMLLQKLPMHRLCREIMLETAQKLGFGNVNRMSGEALEVLMEYSQAIVVDAMECMNDAAIHAKRVTIMPKDFDFMRKATGRFGTKEEHEEAMEAIAEAKRGFAENGRPTKVAKKTATASASSPPPKPADAAESDSDSDSDSESEDDDDEEVAAAVKAAAAKSIATYRSVPALTVAEADKEAKDRPVADEKAVAHQVPNVAEVPLEDIDVVAKPAVVSPPQAESLSAAAIAVPDEKDALTLAMEDVAADLIRVPVVLAAEAPAPEVKAAEPVAVVAAPAPVAAPAAAIEDVVVAATAALAAEAAADKATLAAMLSAPVAPKRGRRAAASAVPTRKSARAPAPRKDM